MASHKPVIINELLGELEVSSDPDYRWVIIHTKPRREKKLANYLIKLNIHYYLPQLRRKKVYKRHKVVTMLPMFPSYIFVLMGHQDRERIAITGHVVRFMRVTQQQQLIDELKAICFINKKEAPLQPSLWLSQGLEVEIISGAFAGTRGIVESHEKVGEVRLQIEVLRQAVMLTIDPSAVKIIGEYQVVDQEE